MQVEQTATSRFISAVAGASQDGHQYFRFNVADDNNEVLTFYTDSGTFNKMQGLQFGDELQLIFNLQQWKTGINVRCIDVVIQKKNR